MPEILRFDRATLSPLLLQVPSPSAEYLLSYLAELRALSVVREHHYIDRHYLGDFCSYYSSSFNPPPSHCARFHFFRTFTPAELDQRMDAAYVGTADERSTIERELEAEYLGFVVKRPLAGASLGRTVLRTYPADGRRHYTVVRPYHVNLGGLRLKVEGLAYQQQDRGAAVCASTALWSALQKVAQVAGFRTPTPSAITAAAESPYPASHGLNELQMAHALSKLGYAADQFAPAGNVELFVAHLVSCLQSQLPVILLVESPRGGHAVTVTGYSQTQSIAHVRFGAASVPPVGMRAASVSVLYVHDDNLGSHAHYELRVEGDANERMLILRRGRSNAADVDWWTPDEWRVALALVPKPPKLRLPVANLFQALALWRPLAEVLFPCRALDFETRFVSGVDYKRIVFDMTLEPSGLRPFLSGIALPRHVGVISVHDSGVHRLDILLDVSQVEPVNGRPVVHGLVAPGIPERSPAAVNVDRLAMHLGGIPVVFAPPTP